MFLQPFKADEPSGTIVAEFPERKFASVLKIVPIVTPDGPAEFDVQEIQVYACFEQETSTIMTTSSGATTTSTTTTKFTPTGTIITTTEHGRLNVFFRFIAPSGQLTVSHSNVFQPHQSQLHQHKVSSIGMEKPN